MAGQENAETDRFRKILDIKPFYLFIFKYYKKMFDNVESCSFRRFFLIDMCYLPISGEF